MNNFLYVLTPSFVTLKDVDLITAVLMTKKVKFLQIRLKKTENNQTIDAYTLWQHLYMVGKRSHTKIIFNDAIPPRAYHIDGVHIGQKDTFLHYLQSRIQQKQKVIGVSCHHSLAQAQRAQKGGATYVSFGCFFPSKTRPDASACTPKILRHWKAHKDHIPAVAIGGITPSRAKHLLRAGAHGIAVCDAIWGARDPLLAVLQFHHIISKYRQ